MNFDSEFWFRQLSELGYRIRPEQLDLETLRMQRVLNREDKPERVLRLSDEEYVEVALIEFDKDKRQLTRSRCTRIARSWKENRLVKPFLLFTDGVDSYAVIVPGRGISGEAKVLNLSNELYRTDIEVLESVRHPGSIEDLSRKYDEEFFPYEKVREEFFEGYRNLYQKLEKAVKKVLKDESSGYAQRFLGRLMFLYFLQRKGWLKKDRKYIDKIKDYRELNKLFYESLNKPGTDFPFLNGSLFEREKYLDGTMEDLLYPKVNPIFLEAREFFNGYNFTVDESSPLDLDVSIDPALIGTVFENMLPEQERGAKGTFYTPVNEISFICRRALVNWLGLKDEVKLLPDGKEEFIDGLETLLEALRKEKNEVKVRELRRKLLSAKILDPAVGSGGFLLVMMQEIIRLIHQAEETVGWKTDPEELKLKILRNLYGFDIEAEAVEIARLRLWLSLIIDQKVPMPLPNLDLNLVEIQDSLNKPIERQTNFDTDFVKLRWLRERFHDLTDKYINETDPSKKNLLKKERQQISEEIKKHTNLDPNTIEASIQSYADMIVMNPPYVSQKSIPKDKKEYYSNIYSLDKESDLYAYFLVRVLDLLSDGGIVSVISSDKWLEASYGIKLQEKLKNNIIGIYGQRWKIFGADVHTVITTYSKNNVSNKIHFVYFDSFSKKEIIRHYYLDKKTLQPGKWFYLRAPKFFVEKILPKLHYKLKCFANIERGLTTNANEFFYMKDISHLYENDYLVNSDRFDKRIKTKNDLEKNGLIYIENKRGDRYIINKKDVIPLIKSPKEINSYMIPKPEHLCLYTTNPGKHTLNYIAYGEKLKIHKRPSFAKRGKKWYVLYEKKPCKILLLKTFLDTLYVPISEEEIICDQRLYLLETKDVKNVWLYLNSTIFFITIQLFSRKGASSKRGAVMDAAVEDYKNAPVIDLYNCKIKFDVRRLLDRKPLKYLEEIKQRDRNDLDTEILRLIGFKDPKKYLPELYKSFIEVVEDRLTKGLKQSA